jgi:glycosyltransferase involved in cell wall biosynthesis
MRIAIVCAGGYVYGKEVMALALASGLKESGHSVQFVTTAWTNGDMRTRLQRLEIADHPLRLGFMSAALSRESLRMTLEQAIHWPGLLTAYHRVLRDVAPVRVIHTNWHHSALLWPLLNANRDLFWLHEILPDAPRYRRIFGLLARRLGLFVAVSHAVAESLLRLGIPADKIRVIHNGIPDAAGERSGARVVSSAPRIGIVGQVTRWKGHDDLLDAFAEVTKPFPCSTLVIFGRGTETFENELKRRAQVLGIADRVVWKGFVPNLADVYPQMDICVVPSRFAEPFGLVAVEAALFGRPVVATRRGGLPEIVIDRETGLLCEAAAPEQIATKLLELCGDADLCRRLGSAARERALLHFGSKLFIDRFNLVLSRDL